MRKIIFILLSFVFCLACSWPSHAAQSTNNHHPSIGLILDNTTSFEWNCEREYNSDMEIPRLTVNAAPSTAVTPSPRSMQQAQRWGATAGTIYTRENAIIRSFLDHKSIIEIEPPVDYYVIELRHLII